MSGKRIFITLLLVSLAFSTPVLAQFDMQLIAVMQGTEDSLRFGYSLAGVGDINQDGFEDLAVGQRWKNPKTFIYLGSTNFDTTADFSFPFFSWHIGNGDINGDSISDLLLTPMGKIFIYYGGTGFDTVADDSVVNNADYFGWNFACGDINKDGYDDLAVYGGYTKVFVYLGGDTVSQQPAYILQGPPNYFGSDGLDIGDVNGDGYGDLAVSMSGHYPEDSTYIYFGGVELDTTPGLKLKGGFVILGDLNGDEYKDLITVEGTYFGGITIDSIIGSPLSIRGDSWAMGNFNNDKYEDLLRGSPSIVGGDAYIYLGGNPLDTIEDWHYRDYEVGAYGDQVGVADINGDGVDEVIVGDPGWWWSNPSASIGRVYIYDNPYTAVKEEQNLVPHSFLLYQNYPNPFNSSTTISFKVGGGQWVVDSPILTTLKIYNIQGQLVKTLLDEEKSPGNHQINWDGRDNSGKEVSSGVYFYQLSSGQFKDSKKLLLIK